MGADRRLSLRGLAAGATVLVTLCGIAFAQTDAPTNTLPNPYQAIGNWAKLPMGRAWGATAGLDMDPDGKSLWALDRCGVNSCAGSNADPILKFDRDGKLVKSFGGGMFVFPHGIAVDAQGNVWVTDGQGRDGKGHQVIKFSPEGQVLMRLGRAGVAGAGRDMFNMPSDVLIAPNGDIFVADGHGGTSNSRIVKFDSRGTYVKEWGARARAPARSTFPMPWPWIRADGCSSATATTTASRFSIRREDSSTPGPSSAGPAASSSMRRT
jgi:NHL repeat